MNDTRLRQAIALLDDTRTTLTDMCEDGNLDPGIANYLTAAKQAVNVGIRHIQIAERIAEAMP